MDPVFQRMGAISSLLINLKKINYDTSQYILFFRGHYNRKYDSIPSIYRKDEETGNALYINKEHSLIKELIRACPQDFTSCQSAFEELVKMQHYNLPTRLLDITTNPLVALFFACWQSDTEKSVNVDGEVIVYLVKRDEIKYFDSDSVSVLANLARRPITFDIDNKEEVDRLLFEIRREKPYFENYIQGNDDVNRVICVKPKLSNPRIIRQDGAFFLFGINKLKSNSALLSTTMHHMIVKKENKLEILNDLEVLGIKESALFPEIDKVSHFLSKQGF